MNEKERERLFRQFENLGEMMGNGLHYEPDGAWISAEYRRIAKLLFPEEFAREDKMKKEILNAAIQRKIKEDRCSCGGELKQVRSGSSVVMCLNCKQKYKYKYKTKK